MTLQTLQIQNSGVSLKGGETNTKGRHITHSTPERINITKLVPESYCISLQPNNPQIEKDNTSVLLLIPNPLKVINST